MKKLIGLIAIIVCALPTSAYGQLGVYGSADVHNDTVRVSFAVHDSVGHVMVAADSINILRYYKGAVVDSVIIGSGQISTPKTGFYLVKYKASSGYDDIGQYIVLVRVWVGSYVAGTSFSYQVIKGGLSAIWDLTAFLGTCDGCVRVLEPIGSVPKDSGWVIDTSKTPDDTLLLLRFHHSVQDYSLDSQTTIIEPN